MKFRNIFSLELRLMFHRKEFLYTFTLMMVFICIDYFMKCSSLYHHDIRSVYSANQLWFGFPSDLKIIHGIFYMFILPFVAAIPYSDTYYLDRNTGVIKSILTRSKKKDYVLAKGIAVFISAFMLIFIPLALNQVLCFFLAPLESNIDVTNWPSYMFFETRNMQFKEIFLNKPYVYNFLFMILAGLFGGIVAISSYAVSFITQKSRLLIVALPGMVYIVQGFISALTIGANYAISYYLYPSISIKDLNTTYFIFLIGGYFSLSIITIIARNLLVRDEI